MSCRTAFRAAAALLALAVQMLGMSVAKAEPDAAALFAARCASCHGADRLGGTGPALIPEALVRVKREAAARTIAEGRPATQMPAFDKELGEPERAALLAYIYTPLAQMPRWEEADIVKSRVYSGAPAAL